MSTELVLYEFYYDIQGTEASGQSSYLIFENAQSIFAESWLVSSLLGNPY